jgi:hypothetical protein
MPGLKMGYDALAGLYEDLGRRQGPLISFEQALVDSCSGEVATDGHVIGSRSLGNSLTEKGYRLQKLGEPQLSMLMAYDVRTGMPLLSRMYKRGAADAVSVRELFRQAHLAGIEPCQYNGQRNLRFFMRSASPPDRTQGLSRSARRTPASPLPARDLRWTYAGGSGCSTTRLNSCALYLVVDASKRRLW